jgi:hypothetical protein
MQTNTVHAQLPLVYQTYIYSSSGEEYFGKYWPTNTDVANAIAIDRAAKQAPENSSYPPMRLFEGCDDLKVRIRISNPISDDTTIYMKFRFTTSIQDINVRNLVTIPDSVPIPHGVTYFEVPYLVKHMPDDKNGSLIGVKGVITRPDGSDYSSSPFDYINIFNRYTYNVEYSARTALHKGYIRLNIQGATPQIVCSFDGGYTWVKPQDEFTGSYLDKALEAGVIYIKEPNSCLLTTIPFGSHGNIGDPGEPGIGITRTITMPYIADAILSHEEGTYYVASTDNFVFTIQPTGSNAGLVPLVKTNRTSIPDSEGVKIKDNADGSYTITIIRVQQSITLSVDFATSNESINNGNRVWANDGQLYIQVSANGIANIYQSTGALAKSMIISAGETTSVSLPAGFYIVKLNNGSTYKIVLK